MATPDEVWSARVNAEVLGEENATNEDVDAFHESDKSLILGKALQGLSLVSRAATPRPRRPARYRTVLPPRTPSFHRVRVRLAVCPHAAAASTCHDLSAGQAECAAGTRGAKTITRAVKTKFRHLSYETRRISWKTQPQRCAFINTQVLSLEPCTHYAASLPYASARM